MSCYLPVLEKIKRKSIMKVIDDRKRSSSVPNVLDEDARPYHEPRRPLSPQEPDSKGFTITQEFGNFPGELSLNIRHNHPTLGLSDVAYQRIHQGHRMDPHQYEKLQSQLQSNASRSRQGVLSLGLPDNFNLFKKSRPNTPGETTLERPYFYEEFIETKLNGFSCAASSSGHSSGSHSPNHQYSTPIDGSPPPLAPKGLPIGPPPPIHRFRKGKGNHID
ncbi:Uncharacterized protein FKW44_004694 [Caligus rogercresseyi]|uniref:Uncharacterized protein n=1 Tax=Caligus rogercresseyi TaxID=217165 RepID=A0A7T8HM17_CALRO|nr:Uncharacterized protein FKW44_004694 [Caligus rogercresseyi]